MATALYNHVLYVFVLHLYEGLGGVWKIPPTPNDVHSSTSESLTLQVLVLFGNGAEQPTQRKEFTLALLLDNGCGSLSK
jgi:hypothetical protein